MASIVCHRDIPVTCTRGGRNRARGKTRLWSRMTPRNTWYLNSGSGRNFRFRNWDRPAGRIEASRPSQCERAAQVRRSKIHRMSDPPSRSAGTTISSTCTASRVTGSATATRSSLNRRPAARNGTSGFSCWGPCWALCATSGGCCHCMPARSWSTAGQSRSPAARGPGNRRWLRISQIAAIRSCRTISACWALTMNDVRQPWRACRT